MHYYCPAPWPVLIFHSAERMGKAGAGSCIAIGYILAYVTHLSLPRIGVGLYNNFVDVTYVVTIGPTHPKQPEFTKAAIVHLPVSVILTQPAWYAEQGLSNGTVSMRLSARLSVCLSGCPIMGP